jgi:hypothetical protein
MYIVQSVQYNGVDSCVSYVWSVWFLPLLCSYWAAVYGGDHFHTNYDLPARKLIAPVVLLCPALCNDLQHENEQFCQFSRDPHPPPPPPPF